MKLIMGRVIIENILLNVYQMTDLYLYFIFLSFLAPLRIAVRNTNKT